MKCYILNKSNLELSELSIEDYMKIILKGEDMYDDCSFIIYDPISGNIRSFDDLTGYWFHSFNGDLDESVHETEEKSESFLDYISDYGRNMALYEYNYSIHNNVKHILRQYSSTEIQSKGN